MLSFRLAIRRMSLFALIVFWIEILQKVCWNRYVRAAASLQNVGKINNYVYVDGKIKEKVASFISIT